MMSRCWLLPAPRLTIEPISTSVAGRLSMIENRPLPISAASAIAGPLLTGSLVLRQRDQAGRAGADAFLHWSRGIDEREGEVAPLSPDHEMLEDLDDSGAPAERRRGRRRAKRKCRGHRPRSRTAFACGS